MTIRQYPTVKVLHTQQILVNGGEFLVLPDLVSRIYEYFYKSTSPPTPYDLYKLQMQIYLWPMRKFQRSKVNDRGGARFYCVRTHMRPSQFICSASSPTSLSHVSQLVGQDAEILDAAGVYTKCLSL